MTKAQQKRSYRLAVQASLETFYGRSKPEATKLVSAWWSRLRVTRAFASGIFLHDEAMNTAADIAGARVIAISDDNRDTYHHILDESRDLVLAKSASSPVRATQTGRRKQLVILAKKPKPTHEEQVAYS